MFKLLKVERMGYAGATTGGVSFIVELDVSKNRFPNIDGNSIPYLGIIIPIDKTEEVQYSIISKLIEENGEISYWGEEEELAKEEIIIIKNWCKENKIEEQGDDIILQYKTQMNLHSQLHEQMRKIFQEKTSSLEEMLEQDKRLEKLRKQAENASKEMDRLRSIKA